MNCSDLFFDCTQRYPDRIALVDRNDRSVSFSVLAKEVENAAAFYSSKGIGKGDRVLVFVPMSIPLYRSVLALFRIGAVAVFLDEWVSRERLEVCCRLVRCKAFIAPLKIRALALFSHEIRRIPIWLGTTVPETQSTTSSEFMLEDETALITFTTGSTGIPKAADRTHGFLLAQFAALIQEIQPASDDIDMPVLPVVTLLNLGSGIPSVIADYNPRKPKTLQPKRIRQQIKQHHVNRLIASPYFIEEIANHNYQFSDTDRKQLKRIFTGGAPVYPDQAEAIQKGFPNAEVHILYGSTEAEPISRITADELRKQKLERSLAVGHCAAATQVRIIPITSEGITIHTEQELNHLKLPENKIGEIIVTGPHVLKKYIDNPEAIRLNKIRIGEQVWHRTGDAGYMDKNDQLFLCGRCTSLIRDRNREILLPFVWEGRLRLLEGVVIGTIIQQGKTIYAVIEAETHTDKSKIQKNILALYPFNDVLFIPSIPRDPRHFSKVDYGKLKEMMMNNK